MCKLVQLRKYDKSKVSFHSYAKELVSLNLYFVQLNARRSKVVRQWDMNYWKDVTVGCMSEESDDAECSGAIIVHHLQWRSRSMRILTYIIDFRKDCYCYCTGYL